MEDSLTKKSQIIWERSSNGEIHLIFREPRFDEKNKTAAALAKAEIREIMKEEAAKPLLILREE